MRRVLPATQGEGHGDAQSAARYPGRDTSVLHTVHGTLGAVQPSLVCPLLHVCRCTVDGSVPLIALPTSTLRVPEMPN